MCKRIILLLVGFLAGVAASAADLTPTETVWIKGAWPVIAFAKSEGMPMAIVVQPQPMPDAAPLSMAFIDGRCKLVLSMRGNPEAEAALDRIDPAVLGETLELMAAHELGHCRRYLDGVWYTAPAGFVDVAAPANLSGRLLESYEDMRAARREEGYGDLVGLAWTARRHPALYERLSAWLSSVRSDDANGTPHDTTAWLILAAWPSALLADDSMFVSAAGLWSRPQASGP